MTDNKNTTENQVQTVDQENQKKEVKQMSKSDMFRQMYDDGKTVAEIAKETESHYSFVYGVIDRHTDGEIRQNDRGPTKSSQFREMWDQGMSVGEIAKETNSNYSFVHSVIKKYRESQEEG